MRAELILVAVGVIITAGCAGNSIAVGGPAPVRVNGRSYTLEQIWQKIQGNPAPSAAASVPVVSASSPVQTSQRQALASAPASVAFFYDAAAPAVEDLRLAAKNSCRSVVEIEAGVACDLSEGERLNPLIAGIWKAAKAQLRAAVVGAPTQAKASAAAHRLAADLDGVRVSFKASSKVPAGRVRVVLTIK